MKAMKSKQELKQNQLRQKSKMKKEIVNDLRISQLRDQMINILVQMLAYNQIEPSSPSFSVALSILNQNLHSAVTEERVTLGYCNNLRCKELVDPALVKKELAKKFRILKNGKMEEIKQHLIFCDKNPANQHTQDKDRSVKTARKCEDEFNKQVKQVEEENEGGPFSTTTSSLMTLLEDMVHQDSINQLDKERIMKTIKSFKEERSKIGGPIVERQVHVQEDAKTGKTSQEKEGGDQKGGKTSSNFKMNIISNRGNQLNNQSQPIEASQSITESDQHAATSQEVSENQNIKPAKHVRFDADVKQDQELTAVQSQPSESLNDSKSSAEGDAPAFNFEELKGDLEEYCLEGMSTFQKVNSFFMDLVNDYLFYYVNGKKSYEGLGSFPKASTRDFLLRQLKIQIEDYIWPSFPSPVKLSHKNLIEQEIVRITYLMDIVCLTQILDQKEWLSITRVFLKIVQKRVEHDKQSGEDKIFHEVAQVLDAGLQLSEEEQLHLELFS